MAHYSKNMNRKKTRKQRIHYQQLIKKLLLRLLKINREENKNLFLRNFDKWGLHEESEIIKHDDEFKTSFDNYIYETHSEVRLNDLKN